MELRESLLQALEADSTMKDRGLVYFRRHQEQIAAFLQTGHSRKHIWRVLHDQGQMPITYEQFNRCVSRYLAS
jgi:hypothetical protein